MMTPRSDVAGVILAGGRNSRMGGHDKAFMKLGPEAIFARSLRVLRECFAEVVVVTNDPEKYRPFEVDVTTDVFPHLGPLAGIHAALRVVAAPYAFVLACDMPFVRREPIEFMVQRIAGQDAVIPCWDGDIEPLHALYAAGLEALIEHSLREGTRAIRDLLPRIRAEYIPEDVMRSVTGSEEAFRNVNTPDEAACFEIRVAGD